MTTLQQSNQYQNEVPKPKRFPWKLLAIVIGILLFAGAITLGILIKLGIIHGDWSIILTTIFAALSFVVPLIPQFFPTPSS